MSKNKMNRLLKVSSWTRSQLWDLKCELQKIEKRSIPMGEVVERVLKGTDIPHRLKKGSLERKYGI